MRGLQVGDIFNGIRVMEKIRDDFTTGGKKRPIHRFICRCGAEFETRIYSVSLGRTTSCGCARHPIIKHGGASGVLSPEYRAYRNMLTRARNPNINNAQRYVLRGISVASQWLPGASGDGFKAFLDHVGQKPSPKHSLDRINNDKPYEPGNVRWATLVEQARNKSTNRLITARGVEQPLFRWAEQSGISARIIAQRIDKLGWDADRAVSVPPKKDARRK